MNSRTSWLYVPANSQKFVCKAVDTNSHVIIYDLEDSVDSNCKGKARENLIQNVRRKSSQEIAVRVNNDYNLLEDLQISAQIAAEIVVIPKVESPKDLETVYSYCAGMGYYPEFFVLVETFKGFLSVEEIIKSGFKICGIGLGVEDLVNSARIVRHAVKDTPLICSMYCQLAVLCQAYQVKLIAPMTRSFGSMNRINFQLDANSKLISDIEFFRDGLGARSKTCIHPSQVDVVNQLMGLTQSDIEISQYIVEQFEASATNGSGVIVNTQGEMEDLPSYRKAIAIIKEYEGSQI
jgi:citrate lyase subunit beta / citryl-CoA lyase